MRSVAVGEEPSGRHSTKSEMDRLLTLAFALCIVVVPVLAAAPPPSPVVIPSTVVQAPDAKATSADEAAQLAEIAGMAHAVYGSKGQQDGGAQATSEDTNEKNETPRWKNSLARAGARVDAGLHKAGAFGISTFDKLQALRNHPQYHKRLQQTFGSHWMAAKQAIEFIVALLVLLFVLWLACILARVLKVFCRFLFCCYCPCCRKKRSVKEGGYAQVNALGDGDDGEGVELTENTDAIPISAADGMGSTEFFGMDDGFDDGSFENDGFDGDEVMDMEYGEGALESVDAGDVDELELEHV